LEKQNKEFYVIHPMFDEPEVKYDGAELGLMKLSKGTKLALFTLRVYILLMIVLLLYHIIDLSMHLKK